MDRELTPSEQEQIDAALEQLTEKIERATAELVHEVAGIRATTAHREVAMLERWWALE